MEQALIDYINWLTASGKAKTTIKNRVAQLRTFIKEINVQSPSEITTTIIVNYVLKLQKTLHSNSINKHIQAINGFCTFHKIEVNVPSTSKVIDNPREVLSKKDLDTQIDTKLEWIFPNAIKVKAILYLLMFCGVRRGEIELLHRKDFEFERNRVTVRSPKTSNFKIVPLDNELIPIIKSYFASEAEDSNAFNTNGGGVEYIIKKLNESGVISLHLTPHLFRHSCTSFLLDRGVPIEDVKEILGHKDINTTMKYCHKSEDKLVDNFIKHMNKSRPRGRYAKQKESAT
jgi:integrase